MVGSVMVIGLPDLIWSIHSGITDPRLHITFPYLVQQILVFRLVRAFATMTFSIMALDVPMAFTG